LLWDEVIYLDADVDVAQTRGVSRDADALGGTELANAAYDSHHMARLPHLSRRGGPDRTSEHRHAHDDPASPTILRL